MASAPSTAPRYHWARSSGPCQVSDQPPLPAAGRGGRAPIGNGHVWPRPPLIRLSEIKIRLKFAPDAPAPNFEADWNKPPPMLVAIRSEDGKRVPRMMRWGLLPHWAKDEKISYSTFNARSEDSGHVLHSGPANLPRKCRREAYSTASRPDRKAVAIYG